MNLNPEAIPASLREICSYYTTAQNLSESSVVLSKSMLAFALELPDKDYLEPVLLKLREEGAVVAIAGEMVAFSVPSIDRQR